MKSTIIIFHPLRTNQELEVILTNQYRKRYVHGMVYNIEGKMTVYEIQIN